MSIEPGDVQNSNEIHVPGSSRIYSRKKLLIVLLVPLFMSLMQVSSINTALDAIQNSLAATDTDLQWIISGYALTFGIILVPAGRLGDIFGRSGAFVTGVAIFALASLLIGVSNDPLTLNLLRIAQGVGSGILSPQTTGLIQQYYQGRARAHAFAMFGLVVAASVAAGPVLSGALIGALGLEVGWRASFLLNFPLGLIAVVLALFWLPFGKERRTIGRSAKQVQQEFMRQEIAAGRHPHQRTPHEKIDLDPLGMVLLAVAVLLIMLPFMLRSPWWVYFIALAGLALIAIWLKWEASYKAHGHFPMVDLALFKIPTFRWSTAIISIMFFGMTSVWAVFSIFLINAMGATPLDAGLTSLPNAVVSALASIWAGKYAYERGRTVQMISLILYALGLLGCVGVTALAGIYGIAFWWFIIPTLLMGAGSGALGAANQTVAMLDVPAKAGGTAGGVLQTGQRIATAMGIAVFTGIFYAIRGELDAAGQSNNWFLAMGVTFSAIALVIIIDVIVAWIFCRLGKAETPIAK